MALSRVVMSSRKKVVVVDDSEIVLHWVETALSDEFDVIGITSAVDAAATIYREKPDMVLLDVKMPVLRGDHIVGLARESSDGRPVPVVLFSGMPVEELAARAAACGADGYIQKSGDTDDFLRRVLQIVGSEPAPRAVAVEGADAGTRPGAGGVRKSIVVAGSLPGLVRELGSLGDAFRILERARGSEVLQTLQVEGVVLLVVGPDLPELTAAALCSRVRHEHRTAQVSILFVGDAHDTARAQTASKSGANVVLLRPFNVVQLSAAVSTLANVASRRRTRLLVRMDAGGGVGAGFQVGFTHNLSSSGMLVESEAAFDVGARVSLRFFLPGETVEFTTDADVVRIERRSADRPLIGLRFLTLDAPSRASIERFVASAM